ncbi:MAG: (2Fe-2S) ferredoxin domain-containing protein [Spirochaetes bacterium]|nr:(2Fe-2S) ferredoxin domain-containing protein [Spirochaetota bacterium]
MAKLTLDDLRKLRDSKKNEVSKRDTEGKEIEVIIGMGTCGIAAGAKETMDAFLDEIDKEGLKNVAIKQTGCMGFCTYEPTVEIKVPGMPDTLYNNVNTDIARRIVHRHIKDKKMVSEYVQDRPSIDIMENK